MSVLVLLLFASVSVISESVGPAGSTFSLLASWDRAELASFVDLNSDQRTDIVIVSPKGIEALIEPNAKFVQEVNDNTVPLRKAISPAYTNPIRNIVSADFNGDSIADLLVLTSSNPNGPFDAHLQYGTSEYEKFEPPNTFSSFLSQPLVCDINADMIADIYGETEIGNRTVFLGGPTLAPLSSKSQNRWSERGYSSFAMVNGSAEAVTIIFTEPGYLEISRVRILSGRKLDLGHPILVPLPKDVKGSIGQMLMGDFEMGGKIQLLLVACKSVDCSEPSILLYSFEKNQLTEVPVNLKPFGVDGDSGRWRLAQTKMLTSGLSLSHLVGPSLGDIDLDGYPDLLTGLVYTAENGDKQMVPVVLMNKYSSSGVLSFQAYSLPGIRPPAAGESINQIAFFDQNEDGVYDVFISYASDQQSQVFLYTQKMANEAYFLKVMLTSGLCGSPSTCPNRRIPYGVPGYGYSASYQTKGERGNNVQSTAAFVTASSYAALQLPFTIFGFGDFANYIERVPVAVPSHSSTRREHSLMFVVPKAQVVVIPFPPSRPDDWQVKLFLEPLYNMNVIYVAITLIATCLLLTIIITILQFLEVRADRQEKLQESQRFHFDAM